MALIQKEYLYNINLKDKFFDSLRNSYLGFDEWFRKIENREAYITKTKEGKIASFLLLKQEDEKEDYSSFEKPFKPAKRLKICTFKVVDTGKGIGKEFIKIIINEAKQNNVDEIYGTVFEEQEALIIFLEQNDFKLYTYKNTYKSDKNIAKEAIYVKKIKER